MSREPSSSSMRYAQALSQAGVPPAPPAPETKPKRTPIARRIRVEPAKPKRDPYKTRWTDLTPEEMASFRLYPKGEGQ